MAVPFSVVTSFGAALLYMFFFCSVFVVVDEMVEYVLYGFVESHAD